MRPTICICLLLFAFYPTNVNVLAALLTGSFLRFSRHEHCGGIDFGDGSGLPDGDFTISFYIRNEGTMDRRMVLESDHKFNALSKTTDSSAGYHDYMSLGSTFSYTSPNIDEETISYNNREWVQVVYTYNRTVDIGETAGGFGLYTRDNTNDATPLTSQLLQQWAISG